MSGQKLMTAVQSSKFTSVFKAYVLPGIVFQSVIIAGGYGTGREMVEYFLNYGPAGGLLGMLLISTVMWSVVLAVSFEFARIYRAHDYRTFFLHLLGRFWISFEVLYLLLLLIVLAVIGSTAGVLLRDNFGLPYMLGVAIMLASVGFLTFKGTSLIEKFLSGWSLLLYGVYLVFFVLCFLRFGAEIRDSFATGIDSSLWIVGAFKYGFYNLGVIPAVLFTTHHIKSRRQAIGAGLLGGVIGIFPGLLFYLAIVGHYPEVLSQEIPAVYVLRAAQLPLLLIVFQVVLLGTLVETGTGMIHAVNERLQSALKARGRDLPRRVRPLVALGLLLLGLALSTFGLVQLVAQGYGAVSWGFLVVYIVPLMTLGLYKLWKREKNSA